jgi:hypothetical protein
MVRAMSIMYVRSVSALGHIYITLTWGFEERVIRVPATSQVTDMGVQVLSECSHKPIAACHAARGEPAAGRAFVDPAERAAG